MKLSTFYSLNCFLQRNSVIYTLKTIYIAIIKYIFYINKKSPVKNGALILNILFKNYTAFNLYILPHKTHTANNAVIVKTAPIINAGA